jgi:hypothetical protein
VYEDIAKEWSEGAWNRSENFYLPEYEAKGECADKFCRNYIEVFGIRNLKLNSRMTDYTSEQIREKWPYVSKYVDPDVWVHGMPQVDLGVLRFVVRRPLNS